MRHVFVSYSHKDNDFAQLLRTELQNAGIQTWLALENIKAGEDWKGEIDEAIKSSFAVVVIISPASDQSKYVTYEWALAHGVGIPIIPILYKRLEHPQKPHPRLESLQYEDFTTNVNRPWHQIIERLNEIQAEYLRKEQRDPRVEDAVQALGDWDFSKIIRAADMLGRNRIQSAIPDLDRLLDDNNPEVQCAALKALGNIGSSQAIEKIINLVDDKNETSFVAIEALGKIGDVAAEAVLIRYLNSDNNKAKIFCINALKNIPSPVFKDMLLGLLQNSKYGWEDDHIAWEEEWEDEKVLNSIFDALMNRVTKDDIPRLKVILINADHADIIVGIIKLLGELDDESSLPQILRLTRNESKKVSKAAYAVLGKFDILTDFQEKLEKLSDNKKDEYQNTIDFFYQHFGLEGLLYILAYQESKAYWDIAHKIEETVTESDINRLLEALQDSEHRVRALIAEVIGNRGLAQACSNLKPLVNDESPFVSGLAIRAIGNLKCTKSISLLKEKLKDTSHIFSNEPTEVRDFTAIALAKLGHKGALHRLQELIFNSKSDLQDEAIELFITIGGTTDNQQLLSMLYGSDQENRITALKILTAFDKKQTLNHLIKALNSKDNEKSDEAIDELSKLYAPLGLILTLTLVNPESRWKIAQKLEKALQPEHSPLIIQLLSDEDFRLRAYLAHVLGSRPDLNLGEHLVQLMDDDVVFVRGLAIRAIGRLKLEFAKERLIAKLKDKEKIYSNSNERICDYSLMALVNIEGQASVKILETFKANPRYISKELIEINQSSHLLVDDGFLSELSRILLSPENNNDLSVGIVDLIGEFGSAKDAHILLDYLASGHGEWYVIDRLVKKLADRTIKPKALTLLEIKKSELRMVCLDILEMHGDENVVAKVLGLLDDEEDSAVILRAIDVLSTYGDASVLDKISSFANAGDDFVRCSVVRAYGRLQDDNSQARIVPFLNDPAYAVRAAAVRALINLGKPKNLKTILKGIDPWASSSDDYFKYEYDMACLEAIGKFGNDKHLQMLRDTSLKHKSPDCRAAAIYALEALNDKEIVDLLIDKLSDDGYAYEYDDSVCNIAARILITIDEKKAKDALKEWSSNLPEDEKIDFTRN